MNASDWDAIAKDYHSCIVSPFQEGVINPLFKKVSEIDTSNMVAADIGCGCGDALGFLSSKFKKVYAIDYSKAMLSQARKKCNSPNVDFFLKDMKDLSEFESKFDVAVSVNSVLFSNISDLKKALESIRSTMKDDGMFFGIFPSMGSILYQGFLILDDQLSKCGDEQSAEKITKRILEKDRYDFVKGTYDDGDCVQKFYYEFELKIRLQDAGFKNVKLSKVLYPYREDISDFEMFEGRPKMWDWFVTARK